MINVCIHETLEADPEVGTAKLSTIPNWEAFDDFTLLQAVDWYTDAVFNSYQQERLDREIGQWLQRVECGEVEGVIAEITSLRELVRRAMKRPSYIVFRGW
ncbi:MAG: hypothetical protein GY720_10175 [bacterium]|nr:hypothetical protein [bacterium]